MAESYSDGVNRYIAMAEEYLAKRREYRETVRKLKFDTIAVHGMYSVEGSFLEGQGGLIEPIFPSTSQAYRDSDEMEAALEPLKEAVKLQEQLIQNLIELAQAQKEAAGGGGGGGGEEPSPITPPEFDPGFGGGFGEKLDKWFEELKKLVKEMN